MRRNGLCSDTYHSSGVWQGACLEERFGYVQVPMVGRLQPIHAIVYYL